MRSWLAILLLLACGCSAGHSLSKAPSREMRVVSAQLATQTQDWEYTCSAIRKSLAYVQTKNPDAQPFSGANQAVSWGRIRVTLEHLLAVLPRLHEHPELLLQEFEWRQVTPDPLMTGYYEPMLDASAERSAQYCVPIYGVPSSLRTTDLGVFKPQLQGQQIVYRVDDGRIAPFFSREEIDCQGVLNATDTPIAWTKDPVDVYFLQVQGSGLLRYPDGSVRHVLYAGKNGREYVSLGKVLIERGFIPKEEMSMQRIRAFLTLHPDLQQELLNTNPSYVFFRLADDGPYGSMGQTLTPMVSMATDLAFLPSGCALAVDVGLPTSDGATVPRTFLGLAQDMGGAIKGNRLDLFCGHGVDAEFLAGHLQARSKAFLLLKRE